MATRRNFLKLVLAAPVAGVVAKLGVFSLEVKSKAAAVASRVNGFYTGYYVAVVNGRGASQVRRIVGYDGTTKVATLSAAWSEAPDSSSQFVILGEGNPIQPSDLKLDA